MINPVGRYLVHSYIYYHLDNSVIADSEYDKMAKYILEHYDELDHPHKHLISKDALEAGTMLLREDEYPTIVKDTAKMVKKGLIGKETSSLDEFFN